MKNLYMGKLCCLDEMELSCSPCSYCGSIEFRTVRDQLLCSIRSVSVPILDSLTAKVMFVHGFPPNILCLRVSILRGIDGNVVPKLATILKKVPNKLNTLGISSKLASFYSGIDAFGFSRGYWELQGLEFISQLKEVTLEITNGSNGLYLAWYFLEHAQYLKKMTIIYSPELPHHIGFMAKVKRTRIISDAIVIFQEKESDDLELFLLSP
uniref:uncharacterized protein LOC105352296 n=1 Tax=Fragaria vesca subsp. vesca TaxID=101020 RepID=UPI0005C8620E|nr:PREDICTED: uncharacterized protein LOC105352296 [Fragaria vesca subsp. vesca]